MILLNSCKVIVALTLIGFLLLSGLNVGNATDKGSGVQNNGAEKSRKARALVTLTSDELPAKISSDEALISGRSVRHTSKKRLRKLSLIRRQRQDIINIVLALAFDWSQYDLPKQQDNGNRMNNDRNNWNNNNGNANDNNFDRNLNNNNNNNNNNNRNPDSNNNNRNSNNNNNGNFDNNFNNNEKNSNNNNDWNSNTNNDNNRNADNRNAGDFNNNNRNNFDQNSNNNFDRNSNNNFDRSSNNQNNNDRNSNNNNNNAGNAQNARPVVNNDLCGLPEPDDNQVCISIKLPWKSDAVYFCTPKDNIDMKECALENTTDTCFDDGRQDSLKIATPWDCCPHISTPNTCDIVKCPPEPFNRTCKAVKKQGDCCNTYYCDKEDPTACKLLKTKPSCTEPPKDKTNCTRFRDPFGCCTKFQCDYEQKPGFCPRSTMAVKMVTKMAINSEGKQIALLVPERAVSAETDLRCAGDNYCPGDQRCCAVNRFNKIRGATDTKDNKPVLLDGACRTPVFTEAESEQQGRGFKKKGRSFDKSEAKGRSFLVKSGHISHQRKKSKKNKKSHKSDEED